MGLCFLQVESKAQHQDSLGVLEETLVKHGFQQVSAKIHLSVLLITYENRVYRFESNAIAQIIKLLTPQIVDTTVETIRIIPLKYGLPMIQIDVAADQLKAFQNGEITASSLIEKITITQSISKKLRGLTYKNKSTFKAEFEIEPHLRLSLGGFPDAVLHQINIRPTANIFLWKGAQVKLQGILPLTNEFSATEENWARPGILVFNQYVRLPANSWAKLSLGYFERFRYGGELQLGKYFFNGNLEINAKLDYTGYASYPIRLFVDQPKRGWQFTDVDYWNYQAGVHYRIPKWDLVIGMEMGKALFFQDFFRVQFYRQFNEVKLGFFALKSNSGENYGFNLSIPLIPKKYWKPRFFSVRPSRAFTYNYQATQTRISVVDTGYDFAFLRDQFNPTFLQAQLRQLLANYLNYGS